MYSTRNISLNLTGTWWGRKVSADLSELCVRACRIALSSFEILVGIHGPNLEMPSSRYLGD